MEQRNKSTRLQRVIFIFAIFLSCTVLSASAVAQGWLTHAHDEQHSSLSTVQSQSLKSIHWHVPVDLNPPQGEIFIHYGSPLVTAANTVIVPVKTGSNSFRVEAHNGATGAQLWLHKTAYVAPSADFFPGLGPTISGIRLYVPDNAGRVWFRNNPDQPTGTAGRRIFYGKSNYTANPSVYQQNVQIDTPLTTDAAGNLFFGFLVIGPTPINLQSGLARVSAGGKGTWLSAAALSGDPAITQVAISCAPALSLNGTILYVVVDNGSYGYLLALNSTTLALINKVRLKDPSSGADAFIYDASSATPTVGPDGDVYYGVLENPFPDHNDRGWMLHFSGDLTKAKIPGSFGWDDTPSIVPASMVPSYSGTSQYLLMSKYNNYCGVGNGDGHNKIAILDPNATEQDPVLPGTLVMKEVLTALGVTPDGGCFGGVREWCINSAAIDSFTNSVMANSEDGKLYRWNLITNTLSEVVTLSPGIGEAYTPTVIGADGTVYAINQAVLDAVGK
jgi:hypothetical protein